ncbi:MAG TPA: maltose alpha-D-glucosyltransferase [Gammaproteobacteria bacterium]|nr:maltose alpha-D-glucosyltransferase [Gammaproteobacteria bacterium]
MVTQHEETDATWYKDAIIYQAHVRSFHDSNADGIGDFTGLIQKLDYLQFLGVTLIWILPFYPSPLKDDGYDIQDFFNVNPSYGSLSDFKQFLREAHRRGMRVMTELVLNHTSSEHPWFQKSRTAKPGSRWRNYYIWSDTTDRFKEARIIFKDFENSNWTWDPVANAYYWHRFYAHQPDLNYDNPETQRAVCKVIDFWLKLGVDGLRLDAVPYLYKREGTSCENLPETHAFLKKIRKYIDQRYKNRFLLAEANQWPEDAVAYFGKDDECQMAFHFPMMPRMYIAIHREDSFPLVDILQQTPAIPDNCQWASFLRNHDELTLEMVTEEERDYMYRIYGEDPQMRINLGIRRRLAPLMKNDRKKIELMNGLLFALPGTPVIYYGDEIGMGDNIYLGDRNGVRTPMQWSLDRNAGFSNATPQQLFLPVIIDPEYNYAIINVELQRKNLQSLLWWMKRLIELRKQYQAFSRGSIQFLTQENRKIFAFLRIYNDEHILVIGNLSRSVQYAQLDLSNYAEQVPIELFGETEFPPISNDPYILSLSAHNFFYFKISKPTNGQRLATSHYEPPQIKIKKSWTELLSPSDISTLETKIPRYLYSCRWFKSKTEKINCVKITDYVMLMNKPFSTYLLFILVEYKEAEDEHYLLPITTIAPEDAENLREYPQAIIAILEKENNRQELLVDALFIPEVTRRILTLSSKNKQYKGHHGKMFATPAAKYKQVFANKFDLSAIKPLRAEQTNTSVSFNNICILKLFRRLERGVNPDVEIGQFLTEKNNFKHIPRLISVLQYQKDHKIMTLAHIQEYIPHQDNAWKFTLDALVLFFEQALAQHNAGESIPLPVNPFYHTQTEIPDTVHYLLGTYAHSAQLIGKLTAEMHLALGSEAKEADFKPEAYTSFDQKALFQSVQSSCKKIFDLLNRWARKNPESETGATHLLKSQEAIFNIAQEILYGKFDGGKIRIHGDYHLGQLLYNDNEFIIIDFEGEPDRPLSERKIKRSPLRDVAGMLRSFHYAVCMVVADKAKNQPQEYQETLRQWGEYWYRWVCHLFLKGYFEEMATSQLLPSNHTALFKLLRSSLLERAIYEVGYELNNRPELVNIPCYGILDLLGE